MYGIALSSSFPSSYSSNKQYQAPLSSFGINARRSCFASNLHITLRIIIMNFNGVLFYFFGIFKSLKAFISGLRRDITSYSIPLDSYRSQLQSIRFQFKRDSLLSMHLSKNTIRTKPNKNNCLPSFSNLIQVLTTLFTTTKNKTISYSYKMLETIIRNIPSI